MKTWYSWACKYMSAGSIHRKVYNLNFFSQQYCMQMIDKTCICIHKLFFIMQTMVGEASLCGF